MKYLSILILLTLITAYSCKKIEPIIAPPITYPNYSQLKVGNYWVYERYEIDTNGVETPLGIYDTCRVEKDTIINGETYFKYVRPSYLSTPTTTFLRDSLHYLVSNGGRIIFSSSVFNEVFRVFNLQGEFELHEWMTAKDSVVNTPYGNFTTSTFQLIYYMSEMYQEFGNPRYMNYRYAENIGIVIETLPMYFTQYGYRERRLVDYHLE